MSKLMDAAVRLYHKREQENWKSVCQAIDGDFDNFVNPPTKLWFWACKRWKNFPYREYELREN